MDDVIDLTAEPTSDDASLKRSNEDTVEDGDRKKIKSEVLSPTISYADEVEVLAAAPAEEAEEPPAAAAGDVEVVATKHRMSLPHMRQHCTTKPMKDKAEDYCDNCYCYVCDIKASECTSWATHCQATDRGHTANHWRSLRAKTKADASLKAPMPVGAAAAAAALATTTMVTPQGPSYQLQVFRRQRGPFEPNHAMASSDPSLTQCRYCQWYNRFAHENFKFLSTPEAQEREPRTDKTSYYSSYREMHPVGDMDRCHACGRIADARDLGKEQGPEFKPTDHVSYLGTRTMVFTLHSHDPRAMEEYKTRWAEHPAWEYDQVAMENDLFAHLLGERPGLARLLAAVPPTTVEHYLQQDAAEKQDAVFFEDEQDFATLLELYRCAQYFGTIEPPLELFSGDVRAAWDTDTHQGTFTVRVFATHDRHSRCQVPVHVARFLGNWFKVFPLKLSELSLFLKADKMEPSFGYETPQDVPGINERITALNASAQEKLDALPLNSSTHSQFMGGTCPANNDFVSTVSRYAAEILPDLLVQMNNKSAASRWKSYQKGVRWYHRSVPFSSDFQSIARNTKYEVDTLLDAEDFLLAHSFVADAAKRRQVISSLQDLMNHMECRGHEQAAFVEGLTVELLPFQLQSLQWATEREQIAGGIQSFFWSKLPSPMDESPPLYYSPLLGRISRSKPDLVRGGIIAEQMGLGKTVISLALILRNPAPKEPASGSPVADIASAPTAESVEPFWDPDLYTRTKNPNHDKRGSILSRGTLVVCNVSLVGQWIEEARSKLEDPGLVYSYHGGSRKRDPLILAQNSIVVTTYETLASDDTFHRKKSDEPESYCPPCEQVRWWRIICDESHVLRSNNNSKSSAVLNLVADNKWLVSGTPVNTTLCDLQNQLRFLGIQRVSEIMGIFRESTCRAIGDRQLKKTHRRRCYETPEGPAYGAFTFLMRAIMMRHSQNQKYRGTSTTLMSLPPKTERVVKVKFTGTDVDEYAKLETAGRLFYEAFKLQHGAKLKQHYLKLIQKLMPLRTACAGGQIPFDEDMNQGGDGDVDLGETENHDDSIDNDEDEHGKKGKKPTKFSKYAYTSKLKKLIEELERLRKEDPTSKSLVFSQFTSTLKWLKEELPRHGFQFRTLSGDMSMSKRAKALNDFQHDPPTTIFLLSMRAGAVGINLTQANRVFLMEPCFNPALEAQAIGRVHRLGQMRSVEITRLIMDDSIETRLQAFLDRKYGKKLTPSPPTPNDKDAASSADKLSDDDGEKKPAATGAMVGSLKSDKANLEAEEFDLLYGVTTELEDPEAEDTTPTEAETDDTMDGLYEMTIL